jgi:hypothetical protein
LLASGAASDRARILASLGVSNNMTAIGGLANAAATGVDSYYG